VLCPGFINHVFRPISKLQNLINSYTYLHGKHVNGILIVEIPLIRTFGDALTEDLFHGTHTGRTKRISSSVLNGILRKLDMLNAAIRLDDLRVPPGNRLEALKGDLSGFYSIRVNDQFRLIFQWNEPFADHVKLVDYH